MKQQFVCVVCALLGLMLIAAMPVGSAAAVYACSGAGGEVYTETPDGSNCHLLEIQPPPLEFAGRLSGINTFTSGPWPSGSAEAQAEICTLFREWIALTGKANSYYWTDPFPEGITPAELQRLRNLDLLFANRSRPHYC